MKDRAEESEMLPANKLENVKRRAQRARKFGHNTCPASRHLQAIADVLAREKCADIEDIWERDHMAATMYSVLESLWKLRTKANWPED